MVHRPASDWGAAGSADERAVDGDVSGTGSAGLKKKGPGTLPRNPNSLKDVRTSGLAGVEKAEPLDLYQPRMRLTLLRSKTGALPLDPAKGSGPWNHDSKESAVQGHCPWRGPGAEPLAFLQKVIHKIGWYYFACAACIAIRHPNTKAGPKVVPGPG